MLIIPAIDLRGGRCVRLRQGNYDEETVFGDDPAAMAAHWVSLGAGRLHLVDLDGARAGRPGNLDSVRAILQRVQAPCQFGGGVRKSETVAELLALGVDRVVVGTRALTEPEWFRQLCQAFPQRVCLGLDARDGKVAVEGWTRTSTTAAVDLARQLAELPLAAIIYTDISRDGMMGGVNLHAIRELTQAVATPVIASGGVTTLEDVRALAALGVAGCIVGRALYEGRISLPEAIRLAERRLV
ncbi:MAG: 1-(5-phosphoribosyl)-5-[(5-phosphoribosylamino)methylideneamino]imidazole-4-carboxamide isomerase [Planctomycetes bacterium]|nr:1-(5-phosphoribosyl)-5-[(5-phosphoribosylamino)methylideneamino]imidazole-4-carboxamide isomerase [Planctomycetota bacterium]